MTTRTYSGTLILENVFDAIPSSNTALTTIANHIFSPTVPIVEADCTTLLGSVVTLTFESEGLVRIDSSTPINRTYITNTLASGVYEVHVRSTASCISHGGLCRACYMASRPYASSPTIGTSIKLNPEFPLQAESVTVLAGSSIGNLSHAPAEYDYIYVYNNGVLVSPSTYTVNNKLLTLTTPVVSQTIFVVKYTVLSRAPFFYWLAGQYAGSLLGTKALPAQPLSLKPSLFSSLLPSHDVDYVVTKVLNSDLTPFDIKGYLPNAASLLEKTLLAIAVDSVFSNVIT